MIVTIRTRYSGATDTRGSRIIATGAGRQKSVSFDYSASNAHDVAARALADLLGLRTVEPTGETTRSGRGFVYSAHNGPATTHDGLNLCDCCAIACANADVSGCEDGLGHEPHVLTSPFLEAMLGSKGSLVIASTEPQDGGYYECDGCEQMNCGARWIGAVLDGVES